MKRSLALLFTLVLATGAAAQPLPPGHPEVDKAPQQAGAAAQPLPPGHPEVAEAPQQAGAAPQGNPDQVEQDPSLPPGSIAITIVDPNDKPIAGAPIELDIEENRVATGESHDTRTVTANDQGEARFDGLATGSGISYRVRTVRGEALFATEPFGLKDKSGLRVLLHAYDPVTDLAQAIFVMEAYVLLDIKQDTIRVNHLLRTHNLGRTAYVARGVRMPLPQGSRSFNQEQSSGAMGMIEKDGALELTGTFPPGQAELTYGYTLPLDSGSLLRLRLPLPPRVLSAQVSVSAGPGMTLEVAGFPRAERGRRRDGQRVLQAVKQLDPSQNPNTFLANVSPGELDLTVRGLRTTGWGPTAAAILAVLALLAGMSALGRSGSPSEKADMRRELAEARDALLGELVVLENARKSGEVGPKSYERLRDAMLDALARILARQNDLEPKTARS